MYVHIASMSLYIDNVVQEPHAKGFFCVCFLGSLKQTPRVSVAGGKFTAPAPTRFAETRGFQGTSAENSSEKCGLPMR